MTAKQAAVSWLFAWASCLGFGSSNNHAGRRDYPRECSFFEAMTASLERQRQRGCHGTWSVGPDQNCILIALGKDRRTGKTASVMSISIPCSSQAELSRPRLYYPS